MFTVNISGMKHFMIKKYDMTFMYIPVLILSILSVILYIVRLFHAAAANVLFFTCTTALLCFFIVSRVNAKAWKVVLILLAIFFSAVYFILGDSLFSFAAEKFASACASFGFFDFLFNTAGIFDFETLVYQTSYGGARLIGNELVCGVVNIVKADPQTDLIRYLSGRCIFLFALLGILLSEKKNFKANLLIGALMLISGNPAPALILLLFTSPPLYFLALLINFCAFIVSVLFEIKGAFVVSPSVFEIVYHSQNLVNFLAVGAVFCAVSYFAARIVKERKK